MGIYSDPSGNPNILHREDRVFLSFVRKYLSSAYRGFLEEASASELKGFLAGS
jgi:hypothetical protein